jgi:5-oxopent-3-ene-1,2,5-tricarboxylate decarboxylase/2-hydroxyhepta-2,4-diene-1,7-dioate isomerase
LRKERAVPAILASLRAITAIWSPVDMHLARIRRTAAGPVELAVRVDEEFLAPIAGLPADPVVVINETADLAGRAARAERVRADEVHFEPPVARCSKICCLALNYPSHAAESGLSIPDAPVLFFKPPSALTGHRQPVLPPKRTKRLDYEVELAVVIGAVARDVPAEQWRSVVAGYTVINDMTARDLQLVNMERNVPWDQAKGLDTFAPLGPYLSTLDEVRDPNDLEISLSIDGVVKQQANTRDMVFDVPRLIADLSDGMTLYPGDVIATGTVAGIAPVLDGDVMHATVERVGTLINQVRF